MKNGSPRRRETWRSEQEAGPGRQKDSAEEQRTGYKFHRHIHSFIHSPTQSVSQSTSMSRSAPALEDTKMRNRHEPCPQECREEGVADKAGGRPQRVQ